MVFIEIHGLWNGQLVLDNASVTKLADDFEDQQKQITILALQKMTAPETPTPLPIAAGESAADFAMRAGFTRLDYYYQRDNIWMIVDILDPINRLVPH